MKPEIIVLVGPAGAGKSSSCKNFVGFYQRISQDDQGKIGHMQLFESALYHRDNIIVDRMNFNKEQRERYLKPAREAGYATRIIVLHVPKQVCFDRCDARKDHPTVKTKEDASKAINFFFSKYERVEDSEADVVERYYEVPELGRKLDAIIVDIDGTLANIDHRLGFVNTKDTDSEKTQKADWKNFFKNIPGDSVNEWCREIMMLMRPRYEIVLCSGRPDDYKRDTKDWLEEHKVFYDALYMRARGDFRRDDIIKQQILDFELRPRYNILMCIDDRKNVTDMWRKNGLTCLQCQEGNY